MMSGDSLIGFYERSMITQGEACQCHGEECQVMCRSSQTGGIVESAGAETTTGEKKYL